MTPATTVQTTSETPKLFHLKHFVLNANPYLNSLYKRPNIHPDIESAKSLLASGKGIYASGSIGENNSNDYLLVTEFFTSGSNECFRTLDGSCFVIA